MKIIAAFDSFKGSVTADEAVEAVRNGILEAHPDAEVVCLPLADGGEGTTNALMKYGHTKAVECQSHDPLMRPITATYAISNDGTTAFMEMAEAAGLTLLKPEERRPTMTTTYGVGEMMTDASKRKCRKIVIGIGGSATCDGGAGMLAALGVRIIDKEGQLFIPTGGTLSDINDIDWSTLSDLGGAEIIAACDVDNPLYGPQGAAYVYAPQKGATEDETALLDNGLRHLAKIQNKLTEEQTAMPSLGAAGGLAFGLMLIGAKLRSGAELMLDVSGIDRHLTNADLVLTGEGSIDRQTLNGKLPMAVLRRATAFNVPVVALAGRVADRELLMKAGFSDVRSINPPDISPEEAMKPAVARNNLKHSASTLIKKN